MRSRLPAEWSHQSGVMLTWPHEHSDWAPVLQDVMPVFGNIAREILKREKLLVVCHDDTHLAQVKQQLDTPGAASHDLYLAICPSNDTWARDHGPITVIQNGKPVLLDFQFNGWGNKYPHHLDNGITRSLVSQQKFKTVEHVELDMVLEGGSIDVNGEGLLMTTTQCLLSASRNASMSREQIEQQLAGLFGIEHFIWLQHGRLQGDDTDAHIDTLARFTDTRTIVHCVCDDLDDPHYEPLQDMKHELEAATHATGQDIRLIPLPLPPPMHNSEGKRLPATYANFLIINGAVLAPVYGCETDQLAMAILRRCFSKHEVIEVDCRALIEQFGSLHCVTMQLPDGVL